jgi:hypothetical protein
LQQSWSVRPNTVNAGVASPKATPPGGLGPGRNTASKFPLTCGEFTVLRLSAALVLARIPAQQ